MKKMAAIFVMAIMISVLPGWNASEKTCRKTYRYTPQDFIDWVNGPVPRPGTSDRHHYLYEEYVDVYREKSNCIVVPKIDNVPLQTLIWDGTGGPSICYRFYSKDFACTIDVYPVVACQKEEYYSKNIGTLVRKKYMSYRNLEYNQTYHYTYKEKETNEVYNQTECYEKKKLQLKGEKVDCVQVTEHSQTEKSDYCTVDLHFFKEGMYVRVNSNYQNEGEKKLLQEMKKCSFQTIYTVPKINLNKKKNKITKKNAVLHATMYNPTKKKAVRVNLFLYDARAKKYKLYYTKKVATKNQKKKTFAIKLNMNSCLRKGKKQLNRRSSFRLQRKKRYKYMIQVKTGRLSSKYRLENIKDNYKQSYHVVGSFRLK